MTNNNRTSGDNIIGNNMPGDGISSMNMAGDGIISNSMASDGMAGDLANNHVADNAITSKNIADDRMASSGIIGSGTTGNDMTNKLYELLASAGIPHLKLDHPPSSTSDESRRVRKAASGLDAIGAKALVQKLTCRTKDTAIAIFVLPGDRKFDTKLALDRLANVKRIRFFSGDEVREATSLEIGCIPPFGKPLFPRIAHLFYDSALLECELVGFNAASHHHSVIMKPGDLVSVARPDHIFSFSVKPVVTICDEVV